MKKVLIVVAIVVVVIVAAGVILVSNLDRIVDARKDTILAQVQEQIGRAVTVEEISVAVFPSIGVSLENVTLADDPAFASEPFVRVADLRVNVKLLPLLRKQVEVKRLVLGGAVINVIRDENGAFNFDSMVPADAESDGSGETATAGAAVPLVLAVADIKDGVVRYVDRAAGVDHTVRDIDFSARDVSFDSEVSFELTAAVTSQEEDVRVSGRAGPVGESTAPEDLAGVPVDVSVSVGPMDAGTVLALLPPDSSLAALAALDVGTVEATLAVRGTLGALKVEDLVARAAILGAPDANVTLNASLSGIAPLGEVDPAAVTVEGDIDAGPLALEAVVGAARSLATVPPELRVGGEVGAKAAFSGTAGGLRVEAKVDAAPASFSFGDAFTKPSGVPASATLECTVGETEISISSLEVTLNDLVARGSGTVVTAPEDPRVDIELATGDADLAKWTSLLPAAAEFSPRGTFQARVKASGSTAPGAKPAVSGTITLKNAGATVPQLPAPIKDAGATLHFTDTTARVDDGALTVGQSVIEASFEATSLTPLDATYRVSATRIYRNDFQVPVQEMPRPEVLDDVVASGRIRAQPSTDTSGPPVIDHDGTVTSAKGTVANLDYTDLSATIRSEGEAIVIDRFSARTLDGTVTGSGRTVPTAVPPTFDVRTEVKQVNLAKYFEHKFPAMSNVIEGRIDLNVSIAGAGKTWDEIATTLEGAGGAVVVRGALLNVNLANELIASLQQLPLVPAGLTQRLQAKHPRLFSGNSTAFENLDGEFTIDGGKIQTSDLFLKAADFFVKGDGWLAFDRTFNLKTSFVFSEKVSRDIVGELPIAKYLQNAEGRIVLPLVLSGDVVKPRIAPDTNAITSAFQRGAVDESKGRLGDEIKDRLGDGVKDLFGGLGKKKGGKAEADTTDGNR